MRRMYDSTNGFDIPTSAQMVAGYVNGTYLWGDNEWARFPHAVKVRIATRAGINDGHVLDVEPGCATPGQAPGWVTMRRRAGVDPTVYCNLSTWPTVKNAFRVAGVADPHWWIARYNGDSTIPTGAHAKQYLWDGTPCNSGGHYDISSVADYWPGVDPAPAAKPVTKPAPTYAGKHRIEEDAMILIYRDSKNVEHVALQNGGTMIGLSAGPARNAHTRAVTNGELPWLAVTVTEWNAAWANHNKLIGA